MDEGEHEIIEEANVEIVVVKVDREGLGVKDGEGSGRGSPPVALPGFWYGSGSGSNSTGSPNGPMINGGNFHWGGKVNSVPHPNIDLKMASTPDPQPFRFGGSSGLPPNPDIIMP